MLKIHNYFLKWIHGKAIKEINHEKHFLKLCYIFIWNFLQEYVLRVDPVSNLGLNAESVVNYHVGEVIRAKGNYLLYI